MKITLSQILNTFFSKKNTPYLLYQINSVNFVSILQITNVDVTFSITTWSTCWNMFVFWLFQIPAKFYIWSLFNEFQKTRVLFKFWAIIYSCQNCVCVAFKWSPRVCKPHYIERCLLLFITWSASLLLCLKLLVTVDFWSQHLIIYFIKKISSNMQNVKLYFKISLMMK
jgi:hypothetical protein